MLHKVVIGAIMGTICAVSGYLIASEIPQFGQFWWAGWVGGAAGLAVELVISGSTRKLEPPVNLALYRTFVQPFVRAMVTSPVADLLNKTHPSRLQYEMLRQVYDDAPAAEISVVSEHRCSLFELSKERCRWPINAEAEEFSFCGNTPLAGLPYCQGHTRLAYRSLARRAG